jgi:hypothetical protein
MATVKEMIAQLQRQRASIDKAIAALEEIDGTGSSAAVAADKQAKAAPREKGTLTEEGRERLRAAMKARWAAKKKAQASGKKKTVRKPR